MVTSSEKYRLRDSFLMDSGSTIHVSRDRERFSNFRKAPTSHYAFCGSGKVPILGYGEIDIELSNISVKRPKKKLLRLHNVAFCPLFPTNLASLSKLEEREMDWNHKTGEITLRGDLVSYTQRIH